MYIKLIIGNIQVSFKSPVRFQCPEFVVPTINQTQNNNIRLLRKLSRK